MTLDEAKNIVRNVIENNAENIIEAGEHIWRNPESGYREVKTSKFLAEKFRELGLQVKTGLALTGFRADLDSGRPGPTLAILGELDSLIMPGHPECDRETGAVHACGHHSCAAGLYGTALGLVKSGVVNELSGRIAFIAVPAEEGIEVDFRKNLINEGRIKSIAGKSQLIREGVFDDVDISYMQHISNRFGYNDHNGAINKKITFIGKSCHAAGPQNGKNALNAMTLALNAIALLRESYSYDPYLRIHGIVTEGGSAVNIVPDRVTMEYMLRTNDIERLVELNKRFDSVVMYGAKAAECEAVIETFNGYMPLINDRELGDIMKKNCLALYPNADYRDDIPCVGGSTDMGDVAMIVPALHGNIPGMGGTLHGVDFYVADPDTAYVKGAVLNAVTAVDLLYGDAAAGKKIADRKKDLMSASDYVSLIDDMNKTARSAEL